VRGYSIEPLIATTGASTVDTTGFTENGEPSAELFDPPTDQQDFGFGDWLWDGRPYMGDALSGQENWPDTVQFLRATGGSVSGDVVQDGGLTLLDMSGKPFYATTTIDFQTKVYGLNGPYDGGSGNAGWFYNGLVDLLHYLTDAPPDSINTAFMAAMWANGDAMQSFTDLSGVYAMLRGSRYNIIGTNVLGTDPSTTFQMLLSEVSE
jgi:hypothetical protein